MTHRKSYMVIIDPNSHERRHKILRGRLVVRVPIILERYTPGSLTYRRYPDTRGGGKKEPFSGGKVEPIDLGENRKTKMAAKRSFCENMMKKLVHSITSSKMHRSTSYLI